jgi:hypothetical protein
VCCGGAREDVFEAWNCSHKDEFDELHSPELLAQGTAAAVTLGKIVSGSSLDVTSKEAKCPVVDKE